MIDRTARAIFAEVVPVGAGETTADFQAKNLDALVSIVSVTVFEIPLTGAQVFGERLYQVNVVGQWDISSPDGNPLFFTKPIGHGETKMPFPMGRTTMAKLCKQAFVLAFNDYFAKVTTEITSSGWWKDTSWQSK